MPANDITILNVDVINDLVHYSMTTSVGSDSDIYITILDSVNVQLIWQNDVSYGTKLSDSLSSGLNAPVSAATSALTSLSLSTSITQGQRYIKSFYNLKSGATVPLSVDFSWLNPNKSYKILIFNTNHYSSLFPFSTPSSFISNQNHTPSLVIANVYGNSLQYQLNNGVTGSPIYITVFDSSKNNVLFNNAIYKYGSVNIDSTDLSFPDVIDYNFLSDISKNGFVYKSYTNFVTGPPQTLGVDLDWLSNSTQYFRIQHL